MGKTYEDLISDLGSQRRRRVETRAAELIEEEKSLRDLRQARQFTQQKMAQKLGVRQHSISRLEQRADMLLSTLRDYIGKMGGELVLTARFPDRGHVRIRGLADLSEGTETHWTRHAPSNKAVKSPSPSMVRSKGKRSRVRARSVG
jgi:DNA-binding XRE family transcriptional regulator